MGDLSIQNLVVEYTSGGYAVRPIDGLDLDVAAGSLAILLGPERLREDDVAVMPGWHLARPPREPSSSATST